SLWGLPATPPQGAPLKPRPLGGVFLHPSTKTLLYSVKNLFNQVSLQNRELADLNQSLERRVEERTRDLQKANLELEKLSTTDTLTGLYNRRYAMLALEKLWANARTDDLGCMLVDADHFKEVNDTYGHDAGDIVLQELATQLKYPLRTDDIVCRLGGDEFLIICPDTDEEGLVHIAQQMHQHIGEQRIKFAGGFWPGSISVGLAARSKGMNKPEELIKLADNGVYAAKSAGKNCVRLGA
ncbi:MAG: diguanylate cyclase, partial [Desulfuromonadales bacterium]|nr:diguanylate cyclase [Desulfuromonadales bacterium]